jgi:hypothetical protein
MQDQIRGAVQLTDFQVLLGLYLCLQCVPSRLGVAVEDAVIRCYLP